MANTGKFELIVGLDFGETELVGVFNTREEAERAEELTDEKYGARLWWTCIRPQKECAV